MFPAKLGLNSELLKRLEKIKDDLKEVKAPKQKSSYEYKEKQEEKYGQRPVR